MENNEKTRKLNIVFDRTEEWGNYQKISGQHKHEASNYWMEWTKVNIRDREYLTVYDSFYSLLFVIPFKPDSSM